MQVNYTKLNTSVSLVLRHVVVTQLRRTKENKPLNVLKSSKTKIILLFGFK